MAVCLTHALGEPYNLASPRFCSQRLNPGSGPVHHESKLTILNKYGLHVRPSTRFAEVAQDYRSTILVTTADGRGADGKSLLQLLALGLRAGAEVTVSADGPDAEEAIRALSGLVASQFGLRYDE